MKQVPATIILSLLMAPTALAQAQSAQAQNKQVSFVLSQDLVKAETVNGKTVESYVPNTKTVNPGDLLREEVALTNVSGKTLGRVQVSVPIPAGTEFAQAATPKNTHWNLEYSIDGGKTFSEIPQRLVTVTEQGRSVTKQVAAPSTTYTNVRWMVTNLKPDESLKLSFRVKVK